MCADHPEDLEQETRIVSGEDVRAVGWVGKGRRFTYGAVPHGFRTALEAHLGGAQPRFIDALYPCKRGWCSLCPPFDRPPDDRHVLVTDGRSLFVAPALIGHFIDEHEYQPPDEFVLAVEARPPGWRNRLALLRHARHGAVWSYLIGQLVLQPIERLISIVGRRQTV